MARHLHRCRAHDSALLAAALFLLLSVAAGCDEGAEATATETSTLPPPVVDLPEPPPAEAFVIQEKNDDGTLRVEGMIENQENHLEKPVRVKGVIVKMSEACDPKKAKEEGKRCDDPHLYINDAPDSRKALVVVGYPEDYIEKAKLEPGAEPRIFEGTYQKVAQGFAATEDGLLLLDAVDGTAVLEEK